MTPSTGLANIAPTLMPSCPPSVRCVINADKSHSLHRLTNLACLAFSSLQVNFGGDSVQKGRWGKEESLNSCPSLKLCRQGEHCGGTKGERKGKPDFFNFCMCCYCWNMSFLYIVVACPTYLWLSRSMLR